MKLHLPKQLFTALLAAITLATPAALTLGSTAWGDWAQENGNTYYYLGDEVLDSITKSDNETAATATVYGVAPESVDMVATIGTFTVAHGDTLKVVHNPWGASNGVAERDFKLLTINNLVISPADGETANGAATLQVDANQNVQLNALTGTFTGLNVAKDATLFLNTKDSTSTSDNYTLGQLTGGGRIVINDNVQLGSSEYSTDFSGTLSVQSGGVLKLGQTDTGGNSMWSMSLASAQVELNGGILRYFAGTTSLGSLSVVENSTLALYATNDNNTSGSLNVGNVHVERGNKLTVRGDNGYNWAANARFGLLTGEGSMAITGNNAERIFTLSQVGTANTAFGNISNESTLNLGVASSSLLNFGTVTNTGTVNLRGTLAGTNSSISGGNVNLVGDITVLGGGNVTISNSTITATDFAKWGGGALSLGDVTFNGVLNMTYDGTLTMGTMTLGEGVLLDYGNGTRTLNLGTLGDDDSLSLFLYGVKNKLSSGVNLGINWGTATESELKGKLTISGLSGDDYSLVKRENDDTVYLVSSVTLTSGWDDNWGAAGLSKLPAGTTSITNVSGLNSAHNTQYFHMIKSDFTAGETVSVTLEDATGDNSARVVVGGFATGTRDNSQGSVTRDVWIQAKSGSYLGIVGGNHADNWGENTPAHFTGDTHILLDGATVGTIIGGNHRDAKSNSAPIFTGNSYISVLSGNVTDSIFGASVNAHKSQTTFTGDTHINVYVPLSVNNSNALSDGSSYDCFAIAGGGALIKNVSGTNILNGNTHVNINLSGYSGESVDFVKKIVGGHIRTNSSAYSYSATINGSTNVTLLGTEAVTFTAPIVGGFYGAVNNGSSSITGYTRINISGASTFSGHIVGGNYATSNGKFNTYITNVLIAGGAYNGSVIGGDYSNSTGTHNISSSNLRIDNGSFSSAVVGGSYTSNTAATKTIYAALTISNGSFTNSIVGGSYTTGASNNTVETTNVNISGGSFTTTPTDGAGDTPYAHVITGGHLLGADKGGVVMNANSTNVTITGGTVGMDIFGGHVDMVSQSGSNTLTATLDSATVTLNGAGASVQNIYGGSFTQRDNSSVNIIQGDIVVDLIAGTVNGNVYAGGRQIHRSKITTENTEVRISDSVDFTSASAVVSGAYQMGCTNSTHSGSQPSVNPSTVTGTKTLVFNGASQDRSGITFDSFDTIQVTNADSAITVGTLSNFTSLTKTGAGTLILGSANSYMGATAVTAGTLQFSTVAALGSTSGVTLSADTQLKYTGTGEEILSMGISGEGSLVKAGSGSLTLNSANSYTGGTTVEEGKLIIANAGAVGSGNVEVQAGATLDVAALPTDWTAANMLSGKVTGTGTLLISQSGLNTGDSGLTTAFTGKVELAENVTFTFGSTGNAKDSQVINTSSLTGVILNNGSVLKFQGTGDNAETNGSSLSRFRNVEVNGTAEINLIDTQNSDDQDAVYLSETTNLKEGSNLKLTASYDGRIIIDNLKGSGTLTSNGTTYTNNSRPIFYTTIKGLDGFTGTLNFTDTAEHTVSVSTGTASGGVSFAGLNMAGGTEVNNTFNVQTDTTVGTVSLSGSNNSINLSEGKSLSVGTGTVTNVSLFTGSAEVASISADTPASLSHVKMTGSGFSKAASAGSAKGSISNANVEIAQLAADASFTIQDMTLSNVKLSAAEGASVALNNVSGSAELAGAGSYNIGTGAAQYTLGMTPAQVGTIENDNGGTALTLSYASSTAITMSGTGSRLWLSADPTVDANGIFGTYNLTLTLNYTLNGIDTPTTTADWQELVGFTGILGDLLTAQTPEATVDLAEGEAAVAAAGTTPTVEYNYTVPGEGAQVGTLVITINGLNVPEPATSTLSLLALAALAARRRRK